MPTTGQSRQEEEMRGQQNSTDVLNASTLGVTMVARISNPEE